MLFDMVLQADVLKAGDTVVTSGLGGDLPKGLLIALFRRRASPATVFSSRPRWFRRSDLIICATSLLLRALREYENIFSAIVFPARHRFLRVFIF